MQGKSKKRLMVLFCRKPIFSWTKLVKILSWILPESHSNPCYSCPNQFIIKCSSVKIIHQQYWLVAQNSSVTVDTANHDQFIRSAEVVHVPHWTQPEDWDEDFPKRLPPPLLTSTPNTHLHQLATRARFPTTYSSQPELIWPVVVHGSY